MLPKYDYVSPGLVTAYNAERDFPDRIEGDPKLVPWAHMRKDDPHKWYCDRTMPTAGFINADETSILYSTALQFAGKPALEIGVLFGWSTWHLALAISGGELTAIDPMLRRIDKALYAVPQRRNVTWCCEESPAAIYRRTQRRWNLIFIDANHDAPHPMLDTVAAEHAAADDALIMFHDVIAPDVYEAVRFLRWKGWKTRIYNTSQVMAACWRGDVTPIEHTPDPAIEALPLPDHLALEENARLQRMEILMADHGYRALSGFVAKSAPDSPGDLAISKKISAGSRPESSAPSRDPPGPSPVVRVIALPLWPNATTTGTMVLSLGDAGYRFRCP